MCPDVLASTANYFMKAAGGWKWGVPWGFEVIVPKDFDLMKSRATFEEWAKLGVRRADGKSFPASGDGILFFPTGVPGPAFIVTPNFEVIKDYNDSDVYALAIGHLSDLMQGGGPIRTPWPAHGTQLPRDDRIALQKTARRARLRPEAVLRAPRFQDARLRPRRAEEARPGHRRSSQRHAARSDGREAAVGFRL